MNLSFSAPPNDGLITIGHPEPSGLADRGYLGDLGENAMTTYWQKLKDPRWQKKRLEAMQEAEFHCQICMDDSQTLHVHHKQYFKGREPWEYDVRQLAVLCESCHEDTHSTEDDLSVTCSFLAMDGPYSRSSVAALVSGFAGIYAAEVTDKYAHHAGALASNVFCLYGHINEAELLELVHLSHGDGLGMLNAIRAYAASLRGAP